MRVRSRPTLRRFRSAFVIQERITARIYRLLAASDAIIHGALRVHEVSARLLGTRLAPTTWAENNGELWLARRSAGNVEVAVDVGANVGEWSAIALKEFPALRQLIAYEPGTVVRELRARIQDARVTFVEKAISDRAGEVSFHEVEDTHMSSAIPPADRDVTRTRTVPTVTLDDDLDRLGIPHVDFLKIDAEGLDLHVLRGASRLLREHRADVVQFEYNEMWARAGSTLSQAVDLLQEAGYRVFVISARQLKQMPKPMPELFIYANFVALAPGCGNDMIAEAGPIW